MRAFKDCNGKSTAENMVNSKKFKRRERKEKKARGSSQPPFPRPRNAGSPSSAPLNNCQANQHFQGRGADHEGRLEGLALNYGVGEGCRRLH